jgi:mannose-1-phosphate guanylyltransferase / mannose-6-phosphate isomerase
MSVSRLVIHPVILSGGSGTRLWPLSREALPKQLLALFGSNTMLQATVKRAAALASDRLEVRPPILICNQEHRFLIQEQCRAIGHSPSVIYLEPAGRNTAPAIALAALHLTEGEGDADALMLVLPADHLIVDQAAFAQAVERAAQAAANDYLTTFGITPAYAETGYGYIKSGHALPGLAGVAAIEKFVEKPTAAKAEAFLAEGGYCWNSGMFVFKASRYLAELAAHNPAMLSAVTESWKLRQPDLAFVKPEQAAFLRSPSDSIDYAIMQKTHKAAVVSADIGWSDVGSWDALWQLSGQDSQGNVAQGDVIAVSTTNSYLRAESKLLAVVGMDNVIVVETKDAVLVMNKANAQEVKAVVEQLKSSGRSEHKENARVYRPWGWYESVDIGEGFQVKRLMVKPGQKLSLQLHHHRAEHWVVVQGEAKVTIGSHVQAVSKNESVYIPKEVQHRLENCGADDLFLIEVQSGSYLGEDDIVRFEDSYGRLE